MTQVTALERAVIRNIAVSTSVEVLVKEISSGPEAVKDNQVNAVILNLKKKGLVSQSAPNVVALTADGVAVHAVEFPAAKDLDTLRHESNLELNRVRPMSVEELVLTNQLVDLRKSSNKIDAMIAALQLSLIADQVAAEAVEDMQLAA
mgnify:CR=1 FL=1|jgi:hypothetical protein